MKTSLAATVLGDALSQHDSESSCICPYTPVFRHDSPSLTSARNVARKIL
jgi:hypothetical protein